MGALANLSDLLIGFHPEKVDLVTRHAHRDSGHTAIVNAGTSTGYSGKDRGIGNPMDADPNGIISVGPNRYIDKYGNWIWMKGTNCWSTYTANESKIWRQTLDVNKATIAGYANWLNTRESAGKLHYSVAISSCVTHASRALNLSGVFNIGIHPYLLAAQMYLWGNGIRPWSYIYFLNQLPQL